MKLFMNGLAKSTIGILISSTLLLTQGCSSQVKSGETSVSTSKATNENPHAGHLMGDAKMPETQADPHADHSMGDSEMSETEGTETSSESQAATAKLAVPDRITPKTAVPLVIDVQDKNGKAIASFDRFQEKLMHLIVVSDDLQVFSHLHPVYKGNGRFEVVANFLQPGNYTLFSDYKPAGRQEQVSVLKTQVPGESPSAPKVDLARIKTFADTKANLTFSQPTLKAGQEVHLIFKLQDAASSQPLKDLQPYLGEQGHLVILQQSSPLRGTDYIHAHAMKNPPVGEVHFITSFPASGSYKLWGQFNRDGKIVTTDFWVNVL